MNANDFFTKDMYYDLLRDIAAETILTPSETPYQKKLKIKGNTYHLRIVANRYSTDNHDYFVSFWDDHNYVQNGYRNQGGSCGSAPNLDTWDSFKDWINKRLSKFPDYTAELNEQLCWF